MRLVSSGLTPGRVPPESSGRFATRTTQLSGPPGVKPTRSYKQDGGWRETDNLGYEDLLPAAKLADLAHTCINAPAGGRREQPEAVGSRDGEIIQPGGQ